MELGLDQPRACEGKDTGKGQCRRWIRNNRNRTGIQVYTAIAPRSTWAASHDGHPLYFCTAANVSGTGTPSRSVPEGPGISRPRDPIGPIRRGAQTQCRMVAQRVTPLSPQIWRKKLEATGTQQGEAGLSGRSIEPWIRRVFKFMLPLAFQTTQTTHSFGSGSSIT